MKHLQRKTLRLQCFDYSNNGAYFITLCTKNRIRNLSKIVGDDALVVPSRIGEKVIECLNNIEIVYQGVKLDYYVIMPDHIHAIIFFDNVDNIDLKKVVKDFKSVTTRFYKKVCESDSSLWQRSYYDHIIRNDNDLLEIRNYIQNNPKKWVYKE